MRRMQGNSSRYRHVRVAMSGLLHSWVGDLHPLFHGFQGGQPAVQPPSEHYATTTLTAATRTRHGRTLQDA
jgi:hypothetical protein